MDNAPTGETLLPCPFCEVRAKITSNRNWHTLEADHDDTCVLYDQHIFGPATDSEREALVAAWNRRTQPTAGQRITEIDVAGGSVEEWESVRAESADPCVRPHTATVEAKLASDLTAYFADYEKRLRAMSGLDRGPRWYGSGLYINDDKIQAILELLAAIRTLFRSPVNADTDKLLDDYVRAITSGSIIDCVKARDAIDAFIAKGADATQDGWARVPDFKHGERVTVDCARYKGPGVVETSDRFVDSPVGWLHGRFVVNVRPQIGGWDHFGYPHSNAWYYPADSVTRIGTTDSTREDTK